MRLAQLLPPFLILGLALAASPARAADAAHGKPQDAKGAAAEEVAGDRKMSAPNIVTPVVREGKLVNYLFVSMDVEFSDKANAIKVRDQAHFLRDALLRASHRTALADPADDFRLNYPAANAVFWKATQDTLGAQNVKKITITSVDSLNRR